MTMSIESTIHLYVWPERFLYLGPGTRTSPHRNHAATWLMAQEGDLRVTLASGMVLEGQVIYIPSETGYTSDHAEKMIVALYWEPESNSFQQATARFDTNLARVFKCQFENLVELKSLCNMNTPLALAEQLLAKIFGLDAFARTRATFSDARIDTALNFLRNAPQAYDSIGTLAARVHLSPSRFAHLFKEQVGVPVRRYVLWQKMRRALDLAIAGDSLTTAALSAGFADSAHLSRTVRALMGVAPEFLFRHRGRLVVHH